MGGAWPDKGHCVPPMAKQVKSGVQVPHCEKTRKLPADKRNNTAGTNFFMMIVK
jgi:hypothetical protein